MPHWKANSQVKKYARLADLKADMLLSYRGLVCRSCKPFTSVRIGPVAFIKPYLKIIKNYDIIFIESGNLIEISKLRREKNGKR